TQWRDTRPGATRAAPGALSQGAVESLTDHLIPLRLPSPRGGPGRGRNPRSRSDALPAARGPRRKHGGNPQDDPARPRPTGALSRPGELAAADAPRIR